MKLEDEVLLSRMKGAASSGKSLRISGDPSAMRVINPADPVEGEPIILMCAPHKGQPMAPRGVVGKCWSCAIPIIHASDYSGREDVLTMCPKCAVEAMKEHCDKCAQAVDDDPTEENHALLAAAIGQVMAMLQVIGVAQQHVLKRMMDEKEGDAS